MKNITIFCDGSCSGNPGPGGWAAIIKNNETNEEYELINGADQTTNNQMELTAACGPLQFLSDEKCEITIYSDSKYLVEGMNEWLKNWKVKGWKTSTKKPVVNKNLWEYLDRQNQFHDITWIWIKGHAEFKENNKVDKLAYEEAQKRKKALNLK